MRSHKDLHLIYLKTMWNESEMSDNNQDWKSSNKWRPWSRECFGAHTFTKELLFKRVLLLVQSEPLDVCWLRCLPPESFLKTNSVLPSRWLKCWIRFNHVSSTHCWHDHQNHIFDFDQFVFSEPVKLIKGDV